MTLFAKFSIAFAVAGLVAVTSGSAQTARNQTKIIIVPLPSQVSCPVAMQAQRGADGSTMMLAGGAHRGIGQQLQLTLNNPKLATISAIRITVHGWDVKGRTLPAGETTSSYASASRTLDLTLSIGASQTADTDIWVSGLTAVDSIDLDQVSYTDGSSWESSTLQACRIMPNPIMLISSK
jgi:hypothetical protein